MISVDSVFSMDFVAIYHDFALSKRHSGRKHFLAMLSRHFATGEIGIRSLSGINPMLACRDCVADALTDNAERLTGVQGSANPLLGGNEC